MYLFLCKFNIPFIIERKESDITLLQRTDEKKMNNIK